MSVKKKRKKGKSKSFAQKKVYDGIQFQSLLEVHCYQQLKAAGLDFEYEKVKFILMESFPFQNPLWTSFRKVYKARITKVRPMTYTPDFVGDGWIIETKGFKDRGFLIRWKLFLKHLYETESISEVFMPTSKKEVDETVKHLKATYK